MSEIHQTTLAPTKLELLTAWLPAQPWYRAHDSGPQLTKVGGYRVDDPAGAVGIEFMVVADSVSGADSDVAADEDGSAGARRPSATAAYYQVVLSYRAAPLDGREHAVIGTMEHGVLGRRWAYDGADDPVAVAALFALLEGQVQPQAQSVSNTVDTTVLPVWLHPHQLELIASEPADHESAESLVRLLTRDPATGCDHPLLLSIVRTLEPDDVAAGRRPADDIGQVTATWTTPDGTQVRGVFARVTTLG